MSQTFYVDNDEEITSIIDRLKKSKARDNYFVIPARALILQSIVNLKLLKKEAEKGKKKIIIVCQNTLIESLARKVGIEFRPNLEDNQMTTELPVKNESLSVFVDDENDQVDVEQAKKKEEQAMIAKKMEKKLRLENIGSSDFFDKTNAVFASGINKLTEKNNKKAEKVMPPTSVSSKIDSDAEVEPNAGQENNSESATTPKKLRISSENQTPSVLRGAKMNDVLPRVNRSGSTLSSVPSDNLDLSSQISQAREEKLATLFDSPQSQTAIQKNYQLEMSSQPEEEKKQPRGWIKKVAVSFFLTIALLAIAALVFSRFVARAKIVVIPKTENKEINLELVGKAVQKTEEDAKGISAQILDREQEKIISLEATGKANSSGQKARGKVVIFNEYSQSPQVLIATTRLLSENGKLFRLVKNVTVPGMSMVGGENKVGAVEAEIVADEAGVDFNIGPSKFSIPGFEGSPKYEKFYAKSEKAISGGSQNGSGPSVITQSDLDSAKKKAEEEVKSIIKSVIEKSLPAGFVLLGDTFQFEIKSSETLAKIGDRKEKFDHKVIIKAKAFAVSANQVRLAVGEALKKNASDLYKIMPDDLVIDYIQSEPNFVEQSVRFKVRSFVSLIAKVDTEKIKQDFLGKNELEIRDILKNYPGIAGVEIEFSPRFMAQKVPSRSKQVEIILSQ